jgi:mutator protein MutT
MCEASPPLIPGVSILCHRNGEVLLIRRGKQPYAGYWSLPGGKVESGESLLQAAHRELLEETGVTAQLGEPVETLTIDSRDDSGAIRARFHLTVFIGKHLSGEPVAGDDAAEARFMPMTALDGLQMTPGIAERILRLMPC